MNHNKISMYFLGMSTGLLLAWFVDEVILKKGKKTRALKKALNSIYGSDLEEKRL